MASPNATNSSASASVQKAEFEAGLTARDHVRLSLSLDGDQIVAAHLRAVGCGELLNLVAAIRPQLRGNLGDLLLPEGSGHAVLLLREVLLKAQGRWSFPYQEEELCHCRAVPTKKVDEAIVSGCHTPEDVSRATRASTSCGTCRPDVNAIINYRLGRDSK